MEYLCAVVQSRSDLFLANTALLDDDKLLNTR